MALIVVYDSVATPQAVTQVIPSADTVQYIGQPNVLINPDLSNVQGVAPQYWKHVLGEILPMTSQERTDYDAAVALSVTLSVRTAGKDLLDSQSDAGIILRSVLDICLDEINALRGWITDYKADVAAATSLADLKTRVAANPDLPNRTLVQLRNAVKSRIDSGSLDV